MGVNANLDVANWAICLTVYYQCGILLAMSEKSLESQIDPEQEYSVTETAAVVGVTTRHVRRLMDAGALEGYRTSTLSRSRRRIYGSSILAFLKARKSQK